MNPINVERPAHKPAQNQKGKVAAKTALIGAVIVVLVGITGFLYVKNLQAQQQLKKLSNPQEAAKAETESLIRAVRQVAELPEGETPTVATVVDAAKLRSQPFFKNAENGDKVLMFTKAKKAYLYRPSTEKIVEIAPINISAPTTEKKQ